MKQLSQLTSRERVMLSLDHQEADRPAFTWGFGPQPAARKSIDTFLSSRGIDYQQLFEATADTRSYRAPYCGKELPANTSFWGWTCKNVSYGAGEYEEFDHLPLANVESVADMEQYAWPDPTQFDYASLALTIKKNDPQHHIARVLSIGNPFEILSWMMGLEKTMELLLCEPQIIHAGLDRITHFFEEQMRDSFEAVPDGFDMAFGADDLGTQHGPMISRDTYRQIIMPYHKRLYTLAHQHVQHTLHHSDGSVFALLDDLIEAGVDCLEAVQVETLDMSPDNLKKHYGDRLAFQGAVSVQQVLPTCSTEQVRCEVRKLKSVLGNHGGYICAPSHAIQAGTPPENVIAMVEEAVERSIDDIATTILTQSHP
jgi:uroporphyrinogen decarboxylase